MEHAASQAEVGNHRTRVDPWGGYGALGIVEADEVKNEPLAYSDALAFIEAIWRSLGVDVSVRRDPLDAEIVLEDILDAEEIG